MDATEPNHQRLPARQASCSPCTGRARKVDARALSPTIYTRRVKPPTLSVAEIRLQEDVALRCVGGCHASAPCSAVKPVTFARRRCACACTSTYYLVDSEEEKRRERGMTEGLGRGYASPCAVHRMVIILHSCGHNPRAKRQCAARQGLLPIVY